MLYWLGEQEYWITTFQPGLFIWRVSVSRYRSEERVLVPPQQVHRGVCGPQPQSWRPPRGDRHADPTAAEATGATPPGPRAEWRRPGAEVAGLHAGDEGLPRQTLPQATAGVALLRQPAGLVRTTGRPNMADLWPDCACDQTTHPIPTTFPCSVTARGDCRWVSLTQFPIALVNWELRNFSRDSVYFVAPAVNAQTADGFPGPPKWVFDPRKRWTDATGRGMNSRVLGSHML